MTKIHMKGLNQIECYNQIIEDLKLLLSENKKETKMTDYLQQLVLGTLLMGYFLFMIGGKVFTK